jgi:hypothetical protein
VVFFWFLKKLLTQKEQIMSKKFLQTSSMLTLIGISFFSFSANSMNQLQRDLDINQRGGNPIPQNYPQPARGGGQLYGNDDYDDNAFLEDYPDIRTKEQKKYDEEVYGYRKSNYPKANTFKGEYTSSDSDS